MAYPHQNLHPPRDPTVFASAAGYHGIPHRRLENNGPIDLPKTHVNGPSNSASTPPARLLTVDEALQFSPLSSIVPFNPSTHSLYELNFSSTDIYLTFRYNSYSNCERFSSAFSVSYLARAAKRATVTGVAQQRCGKTARTV